MASHGEDRITRVLFCGPHFSAAEKYIQESICKVDDVPLDSVPNVIGDYHICVVKSMKLSPDIISCAKKIKLIMQFGVGLEGVDVNAATSHGIKVARIPSDVTGNAASCAEMAIYLMLGLLRKQNEMKTAVEQKRLGDPIGDTLLGKTVFVLGYGNIGTEVAKRLRPFGVKIIATNRGMVHNTKANGHSNGHSNGFPKENLVDPFVDKKGRHEDICEFARVADIVVCCLRQNTETVNFHNLSKFLSNIFYIVDQKFPSSMKKGALLVNIARGGLLNYDAVFHHLESDHLGDLGIDVAWTEPFDPTDPILKFQNVLITPHVAGVTECSFRYMAKVVGDVALQLHKGTTLTGLEFIN